MQSDTGEPDEVPYLCACACAAGCVWHHFLDSHPGDAHIVRAAEENQRDLMALAEEMNVNFAGKGISFVCLPDDRADNGSTEAYRRVGEWLDRGIG